VSVRIRMKRLGRAHRPYFRICAIDKRTPRDGRVLEELGTYDPSVENTDARAVLKKDRVDYWLSVGAQPSEKVAVLIKKYGSSGTHVEQQTAALENLAKPKEVPAPGPAASKPKQEDEAPATQPAGAASEAPAEASEAAEAPAEEPKAEESASEKATVEAEPAEESKQAES